MKKRFFTLCVLSLVMFFSKASSLQAKECKVTFKTKDSSLINHSVVEKEIKKYFEHNPLGPVVKTAGTAEYNVVDIVKDPDTGDIWTIGDLSQRNFYLTAVFSLDIGWFWNTTKLVYMTSDSDFFPNASLVADICSVVQASVDKDLADLKIIIEKLDGAPEGYWGQIWTFYNYYCSFKRVVAFRSSADGGLDFVVIPYVDSE